MSFSSQAKAELCQIKHDRRCCALAEAYGVPAIFLQHRPKHFDFKYADYYQSTGRDFGPTAASLAEAIAMDPGTAPDLSEMQHALLRAFPYDLWKNGAK